MSISAQEVLTKFVLVWLGLQVALKQSEAKQVRICQVVKDCVSKNLQLLIVEWQVKVALSGLVRHCLQKKQRLLKLVVEHFCLELLESTEGLADEHLPVEMADCIDVLSKLSDTVLTLK
mgnify:CR=1 FL=1